MFDSIVYSALNFFVQSQVPVAPVSNVASNEPASNMAFQILLWILLILYGVVCFVLVGLVMFQTSKSEGLAGIMGGSVQNMFKGKESKETKEEILKKLTNIMCVAFVVLSFILSWLFSRYV